MVNIANRTSQNACVVNAHFGTHETKYMSVEYAKCRMSNCVFINYYINTQQNKNIDLRHFCITKSAQDISAQHNLRRSESAQAEIGAEKNEPTWLYSALIRKEFVCEVNSFAFNGNSLHWEHDCIFALPLRSSVNHYYKQVISAQSQ